MTTLPYTSKLNPTIRLKKSVWSSLIGLCLCQTSFALEALSDETLSKTTGEGVAFVPQDASFVFQGEKATAADLNNRSQDTGYIHLTPVGPLTNTVQDTNKDGKVDGTDHSVGKADLFVYGLALSKSDANHNTRIANTSAAGIGSWGSATNPWILKVETENQVPNFDTSKVCAASDPNCRVPYLTLEAPLYNTTLPSTVADGLDAYKLKMGMWADAFVLDPTKKEGDANLYHLGARTGESDATRANRLRLQMIWNDFSINGSRLQIFQTLNGAKNENGMSAFYNNTLGLAGLIRLNSGDASNLKETNPNGKVLRLSTQEVGDSSGMLTTPAVNASSTAPVFSANEGIFIHNLNANLVLGSLYQPLILGTDGANFSLELTRIPNKPEIYKKIYTDYDNPNSTEYLGSTCNVYQCGKNGLTGYQGNNATHSSIIIGTTVYDSSKNTLTAYKGGDAVGISFGAMNPIPQPNTTTTPTASFKNLGSAVIDGLLIQHLKITTKGL